MNAQQYKPNEPGRYFKIFADGTKAPESDPRTDHLVVLDTKLHLEFYVNSVGIDGARARDARKLAPVVAQMDIMGGRWRVAELEGEADTIIRRDRWDPAVDTNLFPGIKGDWHITAKSAAWAPASVAWWVHFYNGVVGDVRSLNGGWALAVRAAGQ